MRPVYIDKYSSGLDKSQVDTINTILFNIRRRFEQATYQEAKREPVVTSNARKVSGSITGLSWKNYDRTIFATFYMKLNGRNINVCEFDGLVKQIYFSGTDSLTVGSATLPGYFTKDRDSLVFYITDRSGAYQTYFCTVIMELE